MQVGQICSSALFLTSSAFPEYQSSSGGVFKAEPYSSALSTLHRYNIPSVSRPTKCRPKWQGDFLRLPFIMLKNSCQHGTFEGLSTFFSGPFIKFLNSFSCSPLSLNLSRDTLSSLKQSPNQTGTKVTGNSFSLQ